MKGKRKIQYHPGQENKSGKATYASTTSTNSSTVPSAGAVNRFGEPGQGLSIKSPGAEKRRNVLFKDQKT